MSQSYFPSILDDIFFDEAPLMRALSHLHGKPSCPSWQRSGVSLYEDEHTIYVEAPVPGIKPENVEVTFDKGGVMIEGKAAEEKSDVKYYCKSSVNYSYQIPLPSGKIDEKVAPKAVLINGMLKLAFAKSQATKPLKIQVTDA